MVCAGCGWTTSTFLVAMSDRCPRCHSTPFVEKAVQDPEQLFVPTDRSAS